MSDPTITALRALVDREGGYKAVAGAIGANDQSIYQIVSGVKTKAGKPKGVGRELREKLERHYPGWMQLGYTPVSPNSTRLTVESHSPLPGGPSQPVRLTTSSMPPPRLGWGALMPNDLPIEFETELPDNAMAPEAPRGSRVIFVRGPAPEAGDWVLLQDAAGNLYCREYYLVRHDHWQARAINPAVSPLDSRLDGLIVLAIYDGMRGRRAPR